MNSGTHPTAIRVKRPLNLRRCSRRPTEQTVENTFFLFHNPNIVYHREVLGRKVQPFRSKTHLMDKRDKSSMNTFPIVDMISHPYSCGRGSWAVAHEVDVFENEGEECSRLTARQIPPLSCCAARSEGSPFYRRIPPDLVRAASWCCTIRRATFVASLCATIVLECPASCLFVDVGPAIEP